MRLLKVKFAMIARRRWHSELKVLLYLNISCFIFAEIVTDDFVDVHDRVIQLLISMYLSFFFKSQLVEVSNKVVDTIVIVD
jgi:hypothetical protein